MKRFAISLIISVLGATVASAQGFSNPIIAGYHPDPSFCAVGEDYYLVNSSFQYFPAVPIFHSRDLVNWEQIGHCLTSTDQVDLTNANSGLGIFAPCLRYHDGVFYMVTTNVGGCWNFYVTATDPAGPWSEPILVDRPGIDPDLFWDEDGKCYFTSAEGGIQMCEIDIATGKVLSEPVTLWNGTGGRYPEGPHVYKRDGWYYLMIAEGGTEYAHSVTIARAKSIWGPYESNPNNPILTHCCEKAQNSPIQGTGHADMLQAADGSWWLTCLGFRPQSGSHHLLGRETFLAPVQWTAEGWPVVNGDEPLALEMTCATLPQQPLEKKAARNEFDAPLGFEWNTLCRPHEKEIVVSDGKLVLSATKTKLNECDSPIFVGRRQEDISFCCTTIIDFSALGKNSTAGLTVYQTNDSHYEIAISRKKSKTQLVVNYSLGTIEHQDAKVLLLDDDIPTKKALNKLDDIKPSAIPALFNGDEKLAYLRIEGSADQYKFYYSLDGVNFHYLCAAPTRYLSSETAGGFTGTYLALFAQGSGSASYDFFEYLPQ